MKLPFLNRHEISYPNIIGAWQQPMWNMMFFLGYLYIFQHLYAVKCSEKYTYVSSTKYTLE